MKRNNTSKKQLVIHPERIFGKYSSPQKCILCDEEPWSHQERRTSSCNYQYLQQIYAHQIICMANIFTNNFTTKIVGFELNSSNNFSNRNINFSECFCCLLGILVQSTSYMPQIPLINYKIKI